MHISWSIDPKGAFLCISYRHNVGMIYGYAWGATDGQSVEAQGKSIGRHLKLTAHR